MQQRVEHALCSCCTSTIAGIVKHIESRAHKSETVSSVIIADILKGLKRAGIVKSNGRTYQYVNKTYIGFIADEPIVSIFDLLPGIIKSNGRNYPFYTNIDDYNDIIRKDIAHKLYTINCGDLIIKSNLSCGKAIALEEDEIAPITSSCDILMTLGIQWRYHPISNKNNEACNWCLKDIKLSL